MRPFIKYTCSLLLAISLAGCDDMLNNELPANQVPTDEAIKSKEDLQKLLNASYDVLANSFNGNAQRFSELLADNVAIIGNSGFLVQVYNRSADFFNSDVGGFYSQPYTAIVRANSVLENLDKVTLTDAERDRFEGEAKFIRGLAHFEMVRLFAQPYGFTADNAHPGIVVKTSSAIVPLKRSSVKQVYEQVIADLTEAEEMLPAENGNYATHYAAKAYLAKVYFQMNDFANAALMADDVISNSPYSFSDDINNRYNTTPSTEAVFSTVSTSVSDNRGSMFKDSYRSINANAPTLRVSDEYYSFLTTNPADERASWVESKDYSSVSDVKVFTKFDGDFMGVTLVGLTELMLISAESHGELNTNLPLAEGYLNAIKSRAGVPTLSSVSAETIILESRLERRKEFAGEGIRLHDIKRIGVQGEPFVVRGAPWDCDGMVLQFPASEQSIVGFEMNPQGGCN
jgi:starch-binding outer membrane protein, SusD/RagB family